MSRTFIWGKQVTFVETRLQARPKSVSQKVPENVLRSLNRINTKNYIGSRKRDCAWGCARRINTTSENLQIEKHKSGRRSFHSPDWFVLSICRFSEVVFILRAQPRAQSFFLFPIVFGINLIHFFDEKKDCVQPEIRSFVSVLRQAIWQKQNEERELFRRAQRFWQRKVWAQCPLRGEKLRCNFLAKKSATLFANTKMEIFGKEWCTIHRQFQRFGKERCKIHRQV